MLCSASVRLIPEYTGSLSSGIRLFDNRRTLKLERVKNTYFSLKSSLSTMRVTTTAHVERVSNFPFSHTDLHTSFSLFLNGSSHESCHFLIFFFVPRPISLEIVLTPMSPYLPHTTRAHFTWNAPLYKRFRSISSQLYFTQSHSS